MTTRVAPLLALSPIAVRAQSLYRQIQFTRRSKGLCSAAALLHDKEHTRTRLRNFPEPSDKILEMETCVETNFQPWWKQLFQGVAVLGMFLFFNMMCPLFAEAARSGGRMGGARFNSYRSSSSSSGFSSGWPSSRSSYMQRNSPQFNTFFFPTYGYGASMGGGSSILTLAVYGFIAYTLFSVIRSFINRDEVEEEYGYEDEYVSDRSTVCKVQVGLLGLARSLQRDLDSLARRADPSSVEGLHYILQETLLALNRNPDYCIYGAAEAKRARSIERAESGFNAMSMQERGKIKEETLSNWGGLRKEKPLASAEGGFANELIVVTILVASVGVLQMPTVRSREDLKKALNRLGSIRSRDLLAVEVLWTPQDDNDSFTPDELVADYPELCSFPLREMESQLEIELSDCVKRNGTYWFAGSVLLAIPLGIRYKSYKPLFALGVVGTVADWLSGAVQCSEERKTLNDFRRTHMHRLQPPPNNS